MTTAELIIGKAYWFDKAKDVQGKYLGTLKFSNTVCIIFEPIGDIGTYTAMPGKSIGYDSKLVIGFVDGQNFTPVK